MSENGNSGSGIWSGIGSAALSAGAGLLGGFLNNSYGAGQASASNRFNLYMWNAQNKYNAPVNQMKRLKEAGLNPNLVYGNGSVVGNTTSSAPTYEQNSIMPYDMSIPSVLGEISAYQNIQNMNAVNKNLTMQNSLLQSQKKEVDARTRNINSSTHRQDYENKKMMDAGIIPSDPMFLRLGGRTLSIIKDKFLSKDPEIQRVIRNRESLF